MNCAEKNIRANNLQFLMLIVEMTLYHPHLNSRKDFLINVLYIYYV